MDGATTGICRTVMAFAVEAGGLLVEEIDMAHEVSRGWSYVCTVVFRPNRGAAVERNERWRRWISEQFFGRRRRE